MEILVEKEKSKWLTIKIRRETATKLKNNTTMTYDKIITALLNRNRTVDMLEHHRNEILKKIRGEVETALFNVKGQ